MISIRLTGDNRFNAKASLLNNSGACIVEFFLEDELTEIHLKRYTPGKYVLRVETVNEVSVSQIQVI